MRVRFSRIAAVLAVASAAAAGVQAQTSSLHLGPRISYQFDLEKVGVGAQLGVPLASHLEFYPSIDYFFVDAGSFWNLNADLKYRFATESIRWLYAGAGLNFARSSIGSVHHSHAGANFFAGAESLKGRVHPFGEFRFITNDGSTGMIAVGLNFTLGHD